MKDIKISFDELAVYITIINVVLGLLFGTFPLIAGLKTENRRYAVYGFISSLIGGVILGVFLAYPIAAIFTWLILRKPAPIIEDDGGGENLVDPETENQNLAVEGRTPENL